MTPCRPDTPALLHSWKMHCCLLQFKAVLAVGNGIHCACLIS